MKKSEQRFVWKDGDIIIDEKPNDHRVMSEAEKAFFLKQQKNK